MWPHFRAAVKFCIGTKFSRTHGARRPDANRARRVRCAEIRAASIRCGAKFHICENFRKFRRRSGDWNLDSAASGSGVRKFPVKICLRQILAVTCPIWDKFSQNLPFGKFLAIWRTILYKIVRDRAYTGAFRNVKFEIYNSKVNSNLNFEIRNFKIFEISRVAHVKFSVFRRKILKKICASGANFPVRRSTDACVRPPKNLVILTKWSNFDQVRPKFCQKANFGQICPKLDK